MTDFLSPLISLSKNEPPVLIWQPNPAYDAWWNQLAALQAQVAAASVTLQGKQQVQAEAQAAVDAHASREPAETIINYKGLEIPNPDHATWVQRMNALQAELNAATAEVSAAQQVLGQAQAAHDALASQVPPTQQPVANADHSNWDQQMAQTRAALANVRWDTIYDEDRAQAQLALNAAESQLAEVQAVLAKLTDDLVQKQGQVQALPAQIAALASEAERDRSACDYMQAEFNGLAQQRQTVASQQPAPTMNVPNPDYAVWQGSLSQLQQAVDAARANLADPQQAVDQAQAMVDAKLADEPDPTIVNQWGKTVTNPAHKSWETQLAKLRTNLNTAKANAAPYQQALASAQAAYNAAAASPPPATVTVQNPEYAQWTAQLAQLDAALADAQSRLGAANARLNDTIRRLQSSQAAYQTAQAQVMELPAMVARLNESVLSLQQAVLQAAAVLTVVDQRIAVLHGQPGSDDVLLAVFDDIFHRYSASESAFHEFDQIAETADNELWFLQSRVDELSRIIAKADADTQDLQGPQAAFEAALATIDRLIQSRPTP